jgi:Flp pilus assembly protein CpaB
MFASLRARLPRIGRAPRLILVATCLLLALAGAVHGKPKPTASPGGRPVVVAARDLPAGHVLSPRDLRIARLPSPLCPVGARGDPARLVRQRLAGPVRAREVLTSTRLVSADLSAGLRAGLVAAPVALDDPHALDLVRAGDRVDVLSTARPPDIADAGPPAAAPVATVAARVLVLAALRERGDVGAELIVAVDRATAARVIRDRSTHVFTAVVVPP